MKTSKDSERRKQMKVGLFAVLLVLSLAYQSLAGCGSCGKHEAAKASGGKGCGDCAPAVKAAEVKAPAAEIQTSALKTLLAAGVPVVVLDARTGKYDDGRRIPGAKQLSPEATEEQAKALIPSKEALVVTYCGGVKCPASSALGARLRSLGFGNVLEYREGIEGWAEAGNEVQKAK
jgi:rhodanese-related sulfurtransferase